MGEKLNGMKNVYWNNLIKNITIAVRGEREKSIIGIFQISANCQDSSRKRCVELNGRRITDEDRPPLGSGCHCVVVSEKQFEYIKLCERIAEANLYFKEAKGQGRLNGFYLVYGNDLNRALDCGDIAQKPWILPELLEYINTIRRNIQNGPNCCPTGKKSFRYSDTEKGLVLVNSEKHCIGGVNFCLWCGSFLYEQGR